MRNNQLFVVNKNCRWFKAGSLARMYINDGSDMPMLLGIPRGTKVQLWCYLGEVHKVPNTKKNLRAFDKALRKWNK